jgi:hypothetical protein
VRHALHVLLVVASLLDPGAAAAEEAAARSGDPVADALGAAVAVERELLAEQVERQAAAARGRTELLTRLTQLHQSLEAESARGVEAVPERIEQLLEQAEQADRELVGRLALERAAAQHVREHLRRIALLERRIDAHKGLPVEERGGVLAGSWDLVLLPLEQRGTCELQHTGAVVSGTYRLEGGYSGSLQGTLVERKVYLVRIDTRLGKIMELEGYLSSDGKQLRGTWLNYELAGAAGSTGHWSATRRPVGP